MTIKQCKKFRIAVSFFVATIVFSATMIGSYILAFVGVLTGIIFMSLVRSKAKIQADEREISMREKAAQMTHTIFAPTIGIGAFLLLIPSYSGLSVFTRGEFAYLESLGMVFAYLTLFLITIYAISYRFLSKKYGGGGDE